MTPIFGGKKEPKEVFDENMKKANKIWKSPKLWKSSEYKKLLKHIEKAQEIAETVEVDQEDIVWLWSVKGSVFYMGYHRLDEALECYDKALSTNPRHWGSSYNRLQVLFTMGKWDEIVKDCDKALEIIPEIRGEKITSILGSPYFGVETWRQVESRLWAQKGVALARLTRAREALRCYDRALEINPRDWVSLNEKGLVLYHLGKYEEATKCIENSLEYGPKEYIAVFRDAPGGRHVPKDAKTLLNKVRVLGTLAGRDLYDLSKQRLEEWVQKERKVEKMHEEIESCLSWAVHFNPLEFFSNILEVQKDWESRGGLKVHVIVCKVCKPRAPWWVIVAPLYFGQKRKGWGYFVGAICPHAKRKMGRDSTTVEGALLEDLISKMRE